jgi:precorrin-6B methylase 2
MMTAPRRVGAFSLAGRLVAELASVRRLGDRRLLARYVVQLVRRAPAVLRTRTLAPVDEAMGDGPYRLRVRGEPIVLAGASFGLVREIYGRRSYLPPGFSFEPADAVVDLGAHAGTFTLLAARCARRVVAVEPDPAWVARLRENVQRNGCGDRVAIEHAAVGEAAAGAPLLSLEELVDRHGLDTIDFLKVDVEGAEFELFRHASGWLPRVRRIAMELHPRLGSVDALVRTLADAGFGVRLTDTGHRPVRDLGGQSGYLFASRRREDGGPGP